MFRVKFAKLLVISTIAVVALLAIRQVWSATNPSGADLSTLASRSGPQKPLQTAVAEDAAGRVVVKFMDEASVRLRSDRLISLTGFDVIEADSHLRTYYTNGQLRSLFSKFDETRLTRDRELLQLKSGQRLSDLAGYYVVETSSASEAASLIDRLNALKIVEIAYFEPNPEEAADIDPPTPDYQTFQDYREAAPDGVDADFANSLPGGDGTGVKIIDIENNWQTTHEDLEKAINGVIGGYPGGGTSGYHGTAVIGELIAGDNGYGVTGICPGADIGMVSVTTVSTAEALYTAIDNLDPGDMILIELHAPGPRYNFSPRLDQLGYVCMEYWQANFDAIQYAWAKGIVVIEAAGNGAEDFDDLAMYGQLFDTTYRNSHAIIAGAGYPPASGSDRMRQSFSNHGARVNLQGYGSGVYTCGYGTLFNGGGDLDQYYTATFSGTSSASPIVTGAAACLQGYYVANFGTMLTSDMIRDALVPTGSPQLGDTFAHIGPRPNLAAAISILAPPPSLYTSPILVDTAVADGALETVPLWLHNRSNAVSLDFEIIASDSLNVKGTSSWLATWPSTGTIAPADSIQVTVEIDASSLEDRFARYKGVLDISWGIGGSSLDSSTYVPVYLTVPCNDLTYTAYNSQDSSQPEYSWVSARDLGTRISPTAFYISGTADPLDDGTAGPRNIGFSFPFYDTTYARFYVGVNGAISFTDSALNVNGYYSGIELPGAPFATVVAPFWGDLVFPEGHPEAGVYLYNPPSYDSLVVEWYHPRSFNAEGDSIINFEIILTKWGEIKFQYRSVGVSGMGATVTVGIGGEDCQALDFETTAEGAYSGVDDSLAIQFAFPDRVYIMAGNVNASGGVDITDLVYLVSYMFQGGPAPQPIEAANVNCSDGPPDIADLVYLVDYMFNAGPAPCYYWQITP